MFNLFNKNTKLKKLEKQYRKLLEEAHKLSASNRRLSDDKMAEADEVLKKIEQLQNNR